MGRMVNFRFQNLSIMDSSFNAGLLESRKARLWLQLCFWLVYLILSSFIFNFFLPLAWAAPRALANVLPLLVVFYGNAYLVNRLLEKRRVLWYLLSALALLGFIGWLRIQINSMFPEINRSALPLTKVETIGIGAFLTNTSILILSTFYQLLVNRQEQNQQRTNLMKEQQAAQLQFLKAQINPHFLFNTLNNIYSLAVVRSEKTADMVLKLSNLLRYVIYDSQSELVPLEKEVEHLEKFIELFEMRCESPIQLHFERSGNWQGNYTIEPMILIPLVENCFKHCDLDTNPEAFVELLLNVEDDRLYFKTRNSKNDRQMQKDKTGGVGLDNIRRRLELKHPGKYQLKLENADAVFTVVLTLPLHPK